MDQSSNTINSNGRLNESHPNVTQVISISTMLGLQQLYQMALECNNVSTIFESFDPANNVVDSFIVTVLGYLMKTYEVYFGLYSLDSTSTIPLQYFDKIFTLVGIKSAEKVPLPVQRCRLHYVLCRLCHIDASAFTWEIAAQNKNWVYMIDFVHRGFCSVYVVDKITEILMYDLSKTRADIQMGGPADNAIPHDILVKALGKFQQFFIIFNDLTMSVEEATGPKGPEAAGGGSVVAPPQRASYNPVTLIHMLSALEDETFSILYKFAKKVGPLIVHTLSTVSAGGASQMSMGGTLGALSMVGLGSITSMLGGGGGSGNGDNVSNAGSDILDRSKSPPTIAGFRSSLE